MRPQIISIVIAAAQNVSAENDAPLHFRAESRAARFAVKFNRVGTVHPRAVADAVEAREIGRRFRSGDDVIRRHCVIRVRQ